MPLHQPRDGSMASSAPSSRETKYSATSYMSPIREGTHSDSDTSSLTVVVSRSSIDKTKGRTKSKRTRKPCKYKYPRTIVEGKKLIIRGKAPLVESGREIYEKLKQKAGCKKQAEETKKTNADIAKGSQRTIYGMFGKTMK